MIRRIVLIIPPVRPTYLHLNARRSANVSRQRGIGLIARRDWSRPAFLNIAVRAAVIQQFVHTAPELKRCRSRMLCARMVASRSSR